MKAIVTSSRNWTDEEKVIEALCELPAGTVILLTTDSGACKFARDRAKELKLDVVESSNTGFDYEIKGSTANTILLREEDLDFCFAFIGKEGSHSAKDLVRRARNMDLEVRLFEE
jgi:hypothetical protein